MKVEDFMNDGPSSLNNDEGVPGGITGDNEIKVDNVVNLSAVREAKALDDEAARLAEEYDNSRQGKSWIQMMQEQGADAFADSAPRDSEGRVIVPLSFFKEVIATAATDLMVFALTTPQCPDEEIEAVANKFHDVVDLLNGATAPEGKNVGDVLVAAFQFFEATVEKYAKSR